MSTEQKKFIRTAIITIVVGIALQISAGFFLAFKVMNTDHFTIQNNKEHIEDIQVSMLDVITKDDFMAYLALLDERNRVLENAIKENRDNDSKSDEAFQKQLDRIDVRIDQIFQYYSRRGEPLTLK